MCCFVILLLFNEMQMNVRRFSAIPHLRGEAGGLNPPVPPPPYLVVFDDKTESHGTVHPSKITAVSFIKLIFWTFNQLSLSKQNLHENKTDTTTSRDFRIIKKYALLP